MPIYIGIDLGMVYSGSAIAYLNNRHLQVVAIPLPNEPGRVRFPSQILYYLDEQQHIQPAIGFDAGEKAHTLPQDRRSKLYSRFKRKLGTHFNAQALGQTFMAIDLFRDLIREMVLHVQHYLYQQQLLADHLTYVFSYPGTWDADINKRRDLNRAIEAAGIKEYRMIPEPIAAALGAIHDGNHVLSAQPNTLFLTCDIGGATTDFALCTSTKHQKLRVKSECGGDPELGIANLDYALAFYALKAAGEVTVAESRLVDDHIIGNGLLEDAWKANHHQDEDKRLLLAACERLKQLACREWNQPDVLSWSLGWRRGISISRDEIAPYFLKLATEIALALQKFLEGVTINQRQRHTHQKTTRPTQQLSADAIKYIVLSGGGASLPFLREELLRVVSQAEILPYYQALEVSLVQRGAAIYAHDHNVVQEPRANVWYGVKYFLPEPPPWDNPEIDERSGLYAYFRPFITKGEPLPDEVSYVFRIANPDDPECRFDILFGNAGPQEDPRQNTTLETLRLIITDDLRAARTIEGRFVRQRDGSYRFFIGGMVNTQRIAPPVDEEDEP